MLQWDDSLLALLASTAQQMCTQSAVQVEPGHRATADSSRPADVAANATEPATAGSPAPESSANSGSAAAVGGMGEAMRRRSGHTRIPTPLRLRRGLAVASFGSGSSGSSSIDEDPFGTWRPWFEGVLSSRGFVKLCVARGRHPLSVAGAGALSRSPMSPIDGRPVPPELLLAVERAERYYLKLLQFAHRF